MQDETRDLYSRKKHFFKIKMLIESTRNKVFRVKFVSSTLSISSLKNKVLYSKLYCNISNQLANRLDKTFNLKKK